MGSGRDIAELSRTNSVVSCRSRLLREPRPTWEDSAVTLAITGCAVDSSVTPLAPAVRLRRACAGVEETEKMGRESARE